MSSTLSKEKKDALREQIQSLATPQEIIPTGAEAKLQDLPGIKAVFVDVYGTIMISGAEPMMRRDQSRENRIMKKTLASFGYEINNKEAERAVDILHGCVKADHSLREEQGTDFPEVDIIEVWKKVVKKLQNEDIIDSFDSDELLHLITEFVMRYDEPWLIPNLLDTLNALQEKGLKLGIISNSQFYSPLTLEALSGQSLEELGFPDDNCFWSFVENIAKPSIHFYEPAKNHVMDALGFKPEEVLFVGNDMLNDIYPADAVGFKTALFAGDERSLRLREDDPRCENLNPELVLTKFEQLLNCVG